MTIFSIRTLQPLIACLFICLPTYSTGADVHLTWNLVKDEGGLAGFNLPGYPDMAFYQLEEQPDKVPYKIVENSMHESFERVILRRKGTNPAQSFTFVWSDDEKRIYERFIGKDVETKKEKAFEMWKNTAQERFTGSNKINIVKITKIKLSDDFVSAFHKQNSHDNFRKYIYILSKHHYPNGFEGKPPTASDVSELSDFHDQIANSITFTLLSHHEAREHYLYDKNGYLQYLDDRIEQMTSDPYYLNNPCPSGTYKIKGLFLAINSPGNLDERCVSWEKVAEELFQQEHPQGMCLTGSSEIINLKVKLLMNNSTYEYPISIDCRLLES